MEYPNLNDLDRKAQLHGSEDGIRELVFGVLLVTWGVVFGIPQLIPMQGAARWFWGFSPMVVALGGFISEWCVRRLKQRYTFPRVGYARVRVGKGRRAVGAIVAAVVAAGFVLLAARSMSAAAENLVTPAMAMVFAVALFIASVLKRQPQMLIPAVVAAVLAVVLIPAGLDMERGAPVLLLAIGATSALVGVVRLRGFVRATPVAPAEPGL